MLSDSFMWPTAVAGALLIGVIGSAVALAWRRGRLAFRLLDIYVAVLGFGLLFNATQVGYQIYNADVVRDGSTDLGQGLTLLRLGFLNVLVITTLLVLVILYRQRRPVGNANREVKPVLNEGNVGAVGELKPGLQVGAAWVVSVALIATGLIIRDGLRANVEVQRAFIEYCEQTRGNQAADAERDLVALECRAAAHTRTGFSF